MLAAGHLPAYHGRGEGGSLFRQGGTVLLCPDPHDPHDPYGPYPDRYPDRYPDPGPSGCPDPDPGPGPGPSYPSPGEGEGSSACSSVGTGTGAGAGAGVGVGVRVVFSHADSITGGHATVGELVAAVRDL